MNLFRQSAASISAGTGKMSNYFICDKNQHSRPSMWPPFLEALLRASSSEVPPTTSYSEPNGSVPTPREHSGRPADCSNEKNTLMIPLSGYSAHGHTSFKRVTWRPICESIQEKLKQSEYETKTYKRED